MGILNLTPDSFSDGGKFLDPRQALAQARKMAAEGADFIDLGAESPRPGASTISEEEELRRLLPVLEAVRSEIKLPLSIDTTKPRVAEACLKRGAHIINDVSGLKDSGEPMARVIRESGAGFVLMHRRGTPAAMQSLAQSENVVSDVIEEISEGLALAENYSIPPEQIVIDPGLGFAKTTEQNLEILRHLDRFQSFGRPVLLGPSRKSFIGELTEREADQREFGTAAACTQAVLSGVQILRAHEVGAMRDAVRVAEALRGEKHVRS